jgi:hypothetical protein
MPPRKQFPHRIQIQLSEHAYRVLEAEAEMKQANIATIGRELLLLGMAKAGLDVPLPYRLM